MGLLYGYYPRQEAKFVQLKESRDERGHVRPQGGGLADWLTRQKRLASKGRLDPTRRQKLEELGVAFSLCTAKANTKRISEKNQERWMAHCGMLKEYHQLNVNCNVPKRYNPALGS
jgi:hypothetical protein